METRKRFENKHVLITGAARGIGQEIARQFANEGAMLSLIDNHKENLQAFVEELNKNQINVSAYAIDISHRKEVYDAVQNAENKLPIDILVNNAGIAFETPFLKIPEDEWKLVLDVNLTGMFF